MELGIGQASEQLDVGEFLRGARHPRAAMEPRAAGSVAPLRSRRLSIRESLGDIAGLLDPECLTVGIEAPDTLE